MQYSIFSHRTPILLSCATFVGLASFLSMASGVPTIYSPYALTIVLPYFIIDTFLPIPELAFVIPAGIFLIANYPLLTNPTSDRLPKWNYLMLVTMIILSSWWHITAYDEAIKWEGARFYLSMIVINVLAVGILGGLSYRYRKQVNWLQSCLVSMGIFLWIFWSAIPYFGELM